MFTFKKVGLTIGLAVVVGILIGLVADNLIAGFAYVNAKQNERTEAELKARRKSREFNECIQQHHPTLRPLIASTYVDTATGDKYNIAGTIAWRDCKYMVFGERE